MNYHRLNYYFKNHFGIVLKFIQYFLLNYSLYCNIFKHSSILLLKIKLLNILFCVYHFVEKLHKKDYEMFLVVYFCEYKISLGSTVQCS